MKELSGIAASPGVAHGPIYLFAHEELVVDRTSIRPEESVAEIARFLDGRKTAEEQVRAIHATALKTLSEDEAEVFEGHIELLIDEELEAEVRERIEKDLLPAETAVDLVVAENAADMDQLEDEYMRERAADLRDIGKRLVYAIAGVQLSDFSSIESPVIIVADDLTPSETAQMDRNKILGFVTASGGRTSHAAIMARSMEIPAVVGCGTAIEEIAHDASIMIDGAEGRVVVDPDDKALEMFRRKAAELAHEADELSRLVDLPATTTDGHQVELAANIGTDADVAGALKHGAEGIGLFRTEFLYMDKPSMPTEEQQFTAYRSVVEAMQGRPVIVRTIDIGGDKGLDYLEFPPELNPFLGWRAIRMCFDQPEVLHTQLRALLRASAFGKVRIMFPMVISVEEVRRLKAIIQTVKDELAAEEIAFDDEVEIGVMIETPAAAVIAGFIAREVDFMSIGTNDLTQYTLAVDRGNERIGHLYNPFHPAVIHLISAVVQAAHNAGIWAGMCGEFAGNEKATPLLVGLGLDELSMSAPSISHVKRVVREISAVDARALAEKALTLSTVAEVESRVTGS